jgi:glycosyltransferase involved in cell wall biosynthesis
MTAISITAVIPLYNKAQHIAEALQSIRRQSVPPSQTIVIDDGSTDGGDRVVEGMAGPDLLLIRQTNAGPGAARNHGLGLAKTQHVAFLDADDVWLPNHLETLGQLIEAHPGLPLYANRLGVMGKDIAPGAEAVDPGSSDIITNYAMSWVNGLIVWTCATMVDREAALAVGGFSTEANRGEDLALWLKLTLDQPMAMGSRVGALYRQEASDLTRQPVSGPDAAMLWIKRRLREEPPLPETRQQDLKDYHGRLALLHAAEWIRFGDRSKALLFLDMVPGYQPDPGRLRHLRLLAGPFWPLRHGVMGLRRILRR